MASFKDSACWLLVDLYLGVCDWKVQRFCWSKGTSLEWAELIYVKISETTCSSDELCLCEEEEDRQIVSSGDSCIKRVLDRLANLSNS